MSMMGGGGKGAGGKSAREIRGGQQAEALGDVVRQQEESIRKLTALVQALWFLVRDRLNLTDEDLSRMVQVIHTESASPIAANCQHCGRPLEKRQPHCLYCGKEDTSRDIFSTLL